VADKTEFAILIIIGLVVFAAEMIIFADSYHT